MVSETRVRSRKAHKESVCSSGDWSATSAVYAQRWWETAETSQPDGGTRAAHSRWTEWQRDAPELGGGRQPIWTPLVNWLSSTENPEITLCAFVYLKVSFVYFFFFFRQTTGSSSGTERVGGLAGFQSAARNCVAMVLRGNIPPAAAAFLYSCQPQKRGGHS